MTVLDLGEVRSKTSSIRARPIVLAPNKPGCSPPQTVERVSTFSA
jgi:hypothetical protein